MDRKDRILQTLEELKATTGPKEAKRLDMAKVGRLIHRLDAFAGECPQCNEDLSELHDHILQLKETNITTDKTKVKAFTSKLNGISSHLQKVHKLIPEGYFMSLYMSIGISLGVAFGLTLMDNLALGMPIGMAIGIAVGSGMDADAKKKGRTI